jgi:hypothetical protein
MGDIEERQSVRQSSFRLNESSFAKEENLAIDSETNRQSVVI